MSQAPFPPRLFFGHASNFVGSESSQKQSVKLKKPDLVILSLLSAVLMFTRKVRGTYFIDAFKKEFILQYLFQPSIFTNVRFCFLRNMSKSSYFMPISKEIYPAISAELIFFHEWYLTMTR